MEQNRGTYHAALDQLTYSRKGVDADLAWQHERRRLKEAVRVFNVEATKFNEFIRVPIHIDEIASD